MNLCHDLLRQLNALIGHKQIPQRNSLTVIFFANSTPRLSKFSSVIDQESGPSKAEVLPNAVRKRIVVEAAESFGWHRFIGLDGDSITMNRFGASAPAAPA